MSRLETLYANLENLKKNLDIYENEITILKDTINNTVDTLKNNTIAFDSPVWDTLLSSGKTDISSLEKGLLSITNIKNNYDEIIDYSVNASNLTLKETIDINGKTVKIYDSNKTDALYVISKGLTKKERKQLVIELKNHLSNDQMSILTFNGDYYHYDITGKNSCTTDYAVVGKTDKGKMYNLETINIPDDKAHSSEYIYENGRGNHTAVTIFNGMVLANQMKQNMETGTVLNFVAKVKEDTDGGQKITAFRRLTFSGGTHESTGSEYATVHMEGDYQKYAYNGPSIYDNTKVYDEAGPTGTEVNKKYLNRYVTVGNGPSKDANYVKGKTSVGKIENTYIPFVVEAGNKSGEQRMQATLCYCYEGNRVSVRGTHGGKDMLKHYQNVVSNWNEL